MLKKIIVACCFFVAVLSCKKYNNLASINEVRDTCKANGRLFLLDTLTQQVFYLPQTKKKILIFPGDATNEINYLYSATTDENGYFTFKNLTRDKQYRLVYEETISGKLYRADTVVSAPTAGLQFILQPSFDRQAGIYLTVLNPSGQIVPKAIVCLFSNAEAYQGGKCDNSNYTIVADAYGHAFQFGILPGRYFVLASASIGNVSYMAKDTVDISTRVESAFLRLSPSLSLTTGIQYTVLDMNGFPASQAKVCLFLNPATYLNGNCEGSNYSDSTNSNGVINFTGLEPRTFYSRGEFTIGSRVYKATDTIQVVAGILKQDTLHLR